MNSQLATSPGGTALAEQVQRQLRDELTVLIAQRDQLRGDGADDYRAADSGDRAEAMRRADDVFRLEDRIRDINHLLTSASTAPRNPDQPDALAEGSTVTLRFPDGEEETFYATSILDSAPEDITAEPLGLNSPLAKAITGHHPGQTISWETPSGTQQAQLLKIEPAG